MAECSYARCVQERRAIKKELQKWTRSMVYVVGLERIAEELMGRRKWKQYQEVVLNHPKSVDGDHSLQDWEPPSKCSLCDGIPLPDAAVIPLSDTESSDSSSSNSHSSYSETPPVTLPEVHHRLPTSSSTSLDTMTTLESVTSMAASLAAVAALSSNTSHPPSEVNSVMPPVTLPFYPPPHGGPMFTPWYLPPSSPHPSGPATTLVEGMRLDVSSLSKQCMPTPVSMSIPRTPGPDQPLDLSAKAAVDNNTQQSLRVPSIDNKHIFKAKPRLSALSGRRTYTEEELQAALRDIQSGKLGTRRAAVIYGIPRSTLRNKVYKLAMEREREIHLVPSDVLKVEDEEKELSGAEEEQEVEKVLRKPLLSMEDILRFSVLENSSIPPPDALRALLHCQDDGDGSISPPSLFSSFSRDGWGGLEHSTLGPYISQLLTATTLGSRFMPRDGSPVDIPKFPNPLLPEIVRRMMAEEKLLINEQLKKQASSGPCLNPNGAHYQNDERKKVKTEVAVHPDGIFQEEEKTMDVDTSTTASGTATPPNVILKIPSFKPTPKNGVASSSSGSAENLFSEQFPSNGNSSPGIMQESSQPMSSSNSCSPPITNLMGKGIGVSLRDVIAKSISQKFQQGTENISPLSHSQQKFLAPNGFDQSAFSRTDFTTPLTSVCSSVTGSVIKTHYNNNNNSSIHEDRNNHRLSTSLKQPVTSGATTGNTSSTGGKGTRPKRGKYRNYDRDSLVEAVRAVQRGEMSVHRAGSYYGVPHSTLEYKVKERHLMRPRKREPKVQLDEAKRKDDVLRISSPEKSKLQSKPVKPPFPATSPLTNTQNGMVKMPPLFDPNLPLGYPATPPFPFWPSNPFHSIPVPDFPRGAGPPANFGTTPEQFFASQMMQRLQEDSSRIHHNSCSPGSTTSRNTSPPIVPAGTLGKNAREIAESLYDGSGSFLDGIIRSSLEMGLPANIARSSGGCNDSVMNPENMSNKALLDQLCQNSNLPRLSRPPFDGSSSDDDSVKRVCGNKCQKTDSGEDTSAIVDLCSLSANSSTILGKIPVDEDSSKNLKASSPVGNTKNSLIESAENLKPPSTETDSINVDDCGTVGDESACDSQSSVLRVDSNESAKEEEQDVEMEETTKSKIINSSTD